MSENKKHMTSIGGQAVLEGVMMIGPSNRAIAVRKPDGEIVVDVKPNSSLVKKYKLTKIPVIRGIVAFFDSMITGVKATMFSASFVDLEAEEGSEPSKFDQFLERKFGDKLVDAVMWVSVVIALVLGVGLFMLFPTVVAGWAKHLFTSEEVVGGGRIIMNLVEAVIRLVIFLIYMWLVSKIKDMQRVFAYHGAEHKTIACYEDGAELTYENIKNYTRFHPRCGTSFLLIVMVMSILFFSFLTWGNVWVRMGTRLLLLPFVAGVSYEIIKFAGRSKNRVVKWLTAPGVCLQGLTTREPDESQVEVAVASLKAVLPQDGEDDKW